jgi:UDP-N-acetylglucosamine--N-acetylmuramyl-(pentapeptide) pyrophosphoryl-undecaprenol N-acetylglucosamine transferase
LKSPIVVAAGGTGGHLFPAEALAGALVKRGWPVHLVTDGRAEKYGEAFSPGTVHRIRSATFAGGAVDRLKAGAKLGIGLGEAFLLMRRTKPAVCVGFGGYPTVPPVLAASLAGVPTIIHEQNAVLGRANKFLASRVTAIAAGTGRVRLTEAEKARMTETGNPVRPAVREASTIPFPPHGDGDRLNLLIFGGSQGARYLSEVVPPALALLEPALLARLAVTQQCRPEDLDGVRAAYEKLGLTADLSPFFRDLPARIAGSHLMISRAGASTVAELAAIGRPAIMVPLPHALDHDQHANAAILADVGGGWTIRQEELTPERLAIELKHLFSRPERLAKAAAAAKAVGRLDAAEKLADLVEAVAAQQASKTGTA